MLGISLGELNYCLKALMDKGWMKMQHYVQAKDKFGFSYFLTPREVVSKASTRAVI